MFERYTEKARRVIFFARYEASQFGAAAITPEHLLLGVLREDKTLSKRFFEPAGLTLESVKRELEERTPPQQKVTVSVELPLSDGAKRVLAFSHEESERLRHRHIGTEHLLLGLLREEGSPAAEILSSRGISLKVVRDELARDADAGDEMASFTFNQPPSRSLIEEIRFYGRRLMGLAEDLSVEARRGRGAESLPHEEGRAEAHGRGKSTEGTAKMNETLNLQAETGRGLSSAGKGRRTVLGIERLLSEKRELLRGARVGLVCNQASVDHDFRHVADLFWEEKGVKLTALFGPQHGIRGDVQDNMVETPHTLDRETGLPVYSLYSETREPTERMLEEVDVLVCDLQDVGCRIYTFVYTVANCMRAAKRYGKKVIVCDRPNPIGGVKVAGNLLEPEYASFVGQFPIPTRHGMTIAELALMFQKRWGIDCDLEVVEMEGWSRELWFDETDAPWVMPSPNMPTLDSAQVFPGTVHVEGTQMSEGRGTTRPFELVGAPYVEAAEYARRLNAQGFSGVTFRAANFLPTFQKHAGQTCGGVQIHVTDRESFEPTIVGVAAIKTAFDLYREHFRWKEPPYEYVFDKNPFDVIAGTSKLRQALETGASLESIEASWREGVESFSREREPFLLY